jgi:hypothetical protein
MKKFYFLVAVFYLLFRVYCHSQTTNSLSEREFLLTSEISAREHFRADSIFTSTFHKLIMLSNFDSSIIARYDKILTYDHQVYVVKIQNITPSHILFLYPFNPELHSISRTEVSQIHYGKGKIDIFLPLADKTGFDKQIVDTARIIIRNRRDWEKVTITEKTEDIAGMVNKGTISAFFEADFVTAGNDYLEKNASIILKKKAANMSAPVVLLINKNFHKAYGDLPSIELEGVIYNYE